MLTFPHILLHMELHHDCIDLLLSSSPHLVRSADHMAPLGASDHLHVCAALYYPQVDTHHTPSAPGSSTPHAPAESLASVRYRYSAIPPEIWRDLKDDLSHRNWSVLHLCHDVNEAVAHLDAEIDSAFRQHLADYCIVLGSKPSRKMASGSSPL